MPRTISRQDAEIVREVETKPPVDVFMLKDDRRSISFMALLSPGDWTVDINTVNRRQMAHHDVPVRERIAIAEKAGASPTARMPAAKAGDAEHLAPRLLRDAAREAGLFQRSVLGHLDHEAWANRVHADGQRLADLLGEMGFRPTNVVKLRP